MKTEQETQRIIVYGHLYCPQSLLLQRRLQNYQINFEWRDVRNGDEIFRDELKTLANGNLSVPTVVFSDGTVMVEPGAGQVLHKLGIKGTGLLGWLQRFMAR